MGSHGWLHPDKVAGAICKCFYDTCYWDLMPGKSLEVRPKPFFIRPMRSFLFDSLAAIAIGEFPDIFDCALFTSTLKASSNFCLDRLQAPLIGNLKFEFSITYESLLIARLHCVSYKLLKQLLTSSSSVFVGFVIGKLGTDDLNDGLHVLAQCGDLVWPQNLLF